MKPIWYWLFPCALLIGCAVHAPYKFTIPERERITRTRAESLKLNCEHGSRECFITAGSVWIAAVSRHESGAAMSAARRLREGGGR